MGPLTDFWRQREEAEFKGVDDVPVRFVRFCAQHNDRLVLICPGRIESYVKYAEVAYDLFHCGFDVMIITIAGRDARAACSQIPTADTWLTSATMLMTWPRSGSSRWFLDMVKTVYPCSFYGRSDCHAFSATLPGALRCNSALRADVRDYHWLPDWMVRHILDWAEGHQRIREEYAIGTGRWRALPFAVTC